MVVILLMKCTVDLGSTYALTDVRTRDISSGVKATGA